MDHPRVSLSSFGLAPLAFRNDLNELRKRVRSKLELYAMSDPLRVSLGGVAIERERIDELKVLHFPAILFESLPILFGKNRAGEGEKILDTPSRTISNRLSAQLSATLYRIFKTIEGVELEKQSGMRELVAKVSDAAPNFFSWVDCWPSSISPRAGYSSPTIIYKARPMLVTDVLMNLAYPNEGRFTFGLKRRCKNKSCINPAHYIMNGVPVADGGELAGFGYRVAMAPVPTTMAKPTPKYKLNALDGMPHYTYSWMAYLSGVELYWHGVEREMAAQQPQPTTGLPTDPKLIMQLFQNEIDEKEKKASNPMFNSMGGKWGKA